MFNGYANFETWAAVNGYSSPEPVYLYWTGRAAALLQAAEDAETATAALAKEIEADLTERKPLLTGIYADLLNAAISSINFLEVAASLIEDVDGPQEGGAE